MKTENPKIYVNDGTNKDHAVGTLLYIQDCPIEPEPTVTIVATHNVASSLVRQKMGAYQSALELAIKGGVEFEDCKDIHKLMHQYRKEDIHIIGKFFDLPSGYSVGMRYEVYNPYLCKWQESYKQAWDNRGTAKHDGGSPVKFRALAILKPLSDNSGHSKEKVKGYPHREICGLCHRVSPIGFFVPNNVWELVVHHSRINDIHCLSCFIERADEKLIDWSKEIQFFPVSLRSHINDCNL